MTRLAHLPPDLLSVPQAAKRLGVSPNHCLKLARDGQLPGAFRVGTRWRVSLYVLERFMHGDLASHPLTPREVTDSSGRLSAQEAERDDRGPDADSAPVVAATRRRGVA